MRIGIDVDGTLTDLQRFEFDRGTVYFKKDVVRTDSMQIRNTFGVSPEEEGKFWDDNIFDYAENFPPYQHAADVINQLHEEGHEIIIITARYHTYLDTETGKKMRDIVKGWLRKNNIYFDKVVFTHENKKQRCRELNVDIMLEDKASNALEIARDRKVILMDQPWNRKTEADNIYRVYSWYQVIDKIKEITE